MQVREIAECFGRLRQENTSLTSKHDSRAHKEGMRGKRRRQVLPSLFRGSGTNKELTFDPLSNAKMYLDEGCTVSTQAGILKDAQKQLCSLSDEHF